MESKRVAFITGAAGAVGRAIAQRLANNGNQIVFADLDGRVCAALANEMGGGAIGVEVDITDDVSVRKAVAEVIERLGRIDILVNNAGVLVREDNCEMEEDVFDRIVNVNLKGPFLITRAIIPHMKSQKYGRLVAITSRNYLAGGMPAYGASKAGLQALTVSWARELGAYGITANAVAPGSIAVTPGLGLLKRTPEEQLHAARHSIARTPIQRLATREDVASAVAYFALEESGFVTGETLYVAGGAQLAPIATYPTDAK